MLQAQLCYITMKKLLKLEGTLDDAASRMSDKQQRQSMSKTNRRNRKTKIGAPGSPPRSRMAANDRSHRESDPVLLHRQAMNHQRARTPMVMFTNRQPPFRRESSPVKRRGAAVAAQTSCWREAAVAAQTSRWRELVTSPIRAKVQATWWFAF